MIPSFCRKLVSSPLKFGSLTNLGNTRLQLAHINVPILINKHFSSSVSPECDVETSFVVSYLISSCGLSRKRALQIAALTKRLKFEKSEGPDKILEFFKNQGFTDTQITGIVSRQPLLLVYRNPVGILLPKIEFLSLIGFSKPHLLEFLSYNPSVLALNLEGNIIPAYNFLKSVLVSNERVVYALRRTAWIFMSNHSNNLIPNIEFLTEIGVTKPNVALLLTNFPKTLLLRPPTFRDCVDEIREMGLDVSKSMFVIGLYAVSNKANKDLRDRCIEVYKIWGWSNDHISIAFKKFPQCMMLSEKNITKTMDFLVNKMGFRGEEIAEFPVVLGSSLEKKLIPRCAVIHVLLSKGLIKNWKLSTVVVASKEKFLRTFVTKFSKDAPELLSVYEGTLDVFKE